MRLTSRQQAFLDKLFDLYREFNGPVHYSVVAERLGVNKFSAYDMLKLLEKKGVAASSYVLGQKHAGPGRSMVVFYPTYQATRFLTQLRHEVLGSDEWQQAKELLLQRLRLSTAMQLLPTASVPQLFMNIPQRLLSQRYYLRTPCIFPTGRSMLTAKPAKFSSKILITGV